MAKVPSIINQTASQFDGLYTLSGESSLHLGNKVVYNVKQTEDQCLSDLRITDPSTDKKRIESIRGGLLRDSFVWVIDNSDFRQWRDNQDQRLLWVKGDPGKGKTMLLCGIINHLQTESAKARPIAYFFCEATDQRINTATAVLRSLIWMILSEHSSLVPYVKEKYDRAGKTLFEDVNAWQELSEIFIRMLSDPKLRNVILIVDALDECVSDLQSLLGLIVETSTSTSAKWLVSSRNWPQIEERLRNAAHGLSLELNANSVSTAVHNYIQYKVYELAARKGYEEQTKATVIQHLSSNADGTFLWVSLVCHELRDAEDWNVKDIIKSFPKGLSSLYERMVEQLNKSRHANLCIPIIASLLLSYRPLSLEEVTLYINELKGFPVSSLRKLIGYCGSFLTIPKNTDTIYFIHQSAKEYLIKHTQNIFFPQGIRIRHHTILECSIQALNEILCANMYRLLSPGVRVDRIPMSVHVNIPLYKARYACVYWTYHLEDATLAEDGGLIHKFLLVHFLHWLEALGFMGHLASAIGALMKALFILQRSQKAEGKVYELLCDALKFTQRYRIIIEAAPLQVYNCLIFSPTQSMIRKQFLVKPEWLLMTPTAGTEWSPLLLELQGHENMVLSVAFSPNGRYLVSGSKDSTARIWDMVTGVCTKRLVGHSGSVTSVSFSPNGQYVASSSEDGTIRIWNAISGDFLGKLESQIDGLNTALVAFPQNNHVVLINKTGRICSWNPMTGTPVIFNIREIPISLCVSGSGNSAAWISEQEEAIIVADLADLADLADPADPANLIPGSDEIYEFPPDTEIQEFFYDRTHVALSYDGELMAVSVDCYQDGVHELEECCAIHVYEWATGEYSEPLEHIVTGLSLPLAVSRDNRFVVAIRDSETWKWDVATDQKTLFLKQFDHERRDIISDMEFSPDGNVLATLGEYDFGVRVWEMVATRDGHTQQECQIKEMTLSPDDQLLGMVEDHDCREDDKWPEKDNIQIWDTRNNKLLRSIATQGEEPRCEFLPDSRHLACISRLPGGYKVIELFDAIEGDCLWESKKKYYRSFGHGILFSSDGKKLASAFARNENSHLGCDTIQVLDTATGDEVVSPFPVTGLDGPIKNPTFAFTPDGTRIGVTSYSRAESHDHLHRPCINLFEINTGECKGSVDLPYDAPDWPEFTTGDYRKFRFAFSPDVIYIAYIERYEVIRIVYLPTGNLVKTLQGFWDSRSGQSLQWERTGLLTHRGIYRTEALLADTRNSIE